RAKYTVGIDKGSDPGFYGENRPFGPVSFFKYFSTASNGPHSQLREWRRRAPNGPKKSLHLSFQRTPSRASSSTMPTAASASRIRSAVAKSFRFLASSRSPTI